MPYRGDINKRDGRRASAASNSNPLAGLGDKQEYSAAPTQANVEQSRIGGGEIMFGRGANQIGGTNTTSQLADLIFAGMDAAESAANTMARYAKYRDNDLRDQLAAEVREAEADPELSDKAKEVFKAAKYSTYEQKAHTRAFSEELKDAELDSAKKVRPLSFGEYEFRYNVERQAILDRDYGVDGEEQQLKDLIALGNKYEPSFRTLAKGDYNLTQRTEAILSGYMTDVDNQRVAVIEDAVETAYGDISERADNFVLDLQNRGLPIPEGVDLVTAFKTHLHDNGAVPEIDDELMSAEMDEVLFDTIQAKVKRAEPHLRRAAHHRRGEVLISNAQGAEIKWNNYTGDSNQLDDDSMRHWANAAYAWLNTVQPGDSVLSAIPHLQKLITSLGDASSGTMTVDESKAMGIDIIRDFMLDKSMDEETINAAVRRLEAAPAANPKTIEKSAKIEDLNAVEYDRNNKSVKANWDIIAEAATRNNLWLGTTVSERMRTNFRLGASVEILKGSAFHASNVLGPRLSVEMGDKNVTGKVALLASLTQDAANNNVDFVDLPKFIRGRLADMGVAEGMDEVVSAYLSDNIIAESYRASRSFRRGDITRDNALANIGRVKTAWSGDPKYTETGGTYIQVPEKLPATNTAQRNAKRVEDGFRGRVPTMRNPVSIADQIGNLIYNYSLAGDEMALAKGEALAEMVSFAVGRNVSVSKAREIRDQLEIMASDPGKAEQGEEMLRQTLLRERTDPLTDYRMTVNEDSKYARTLATLPETVSVFDMAGMIMDVSKYSDDLTIQNDVMEKLLELSGEYTFEDFERILNEVGFEIKTLQRENENQADTLPRVLVQRQEAIVEAMEGGAALITWGLGPSQRTMYQGVPQTAQTRAGGDQRGGIEGATEIGVMQAQWRNQLDKTFNGKQDQVDRYLKILEAPANINTPEEQGKFASYAGFVQERDERLFTGKHYGPRITKLEDEVTEILGLSRDETRALALTYNKEKLGITAPGMVSLAMLVKGDIPDGSLDISTFGETEFSYSSSYGEQVVRFGEDGDSMPVPWPAGTDLNITGQAKSPEMAQPLDTPDGVANINPEEVSDYIRRLNRADEIDQRMSDEKSVIQAMIDTPIEIVGSFLWLFGTDVATKTYNPKENKQGGLRDLDRDALDAMSDLSPKIFKNTTMGSALGMRRNQ